MRERKEGKSVREQASELALSRVAIMFKKLGTYICYIYPEQPLHVLSGNKGLGVREGYLCLCGILVHLGCHNKNTRLVAYKQQKFISHSSVGWEAQDHDAGRFLCGESPLPASDSIFLLCSHVAGGVRSSLGLFYKVLIPFLWFNHLQIIPSPNIITLGIRFQHMNFGGG